MAVKFGLLPIGQRGAGGGLREWSKQLAELERYDAVDSLWIGEGPPVGGMRGMRPGPEIMTRLAALAMTTTRVRLGVACLASFPTRDPLYVASQWASLDHLAGPGRMILIVCQGQPRRYEGEDRAFGIAWGAPRIKRMEESLAVIRKAWTEETLTFHGTYFNYDDLTYGPKPATQPMPPIYIAGNPSATAEGRPVTGLVRRLALYADGWQTTHMPVEVFAPRWEDVKTALRNAGRDPSAFVVNLYYNVVIGDDRGAAFAEAKAWLEGFYGRAMTREEVDSWTAYGTPRDVTEKLKTWEDAGATEFVIRITARDQAGQTRRLLGEVVPQFDLAPARA